MIQVGLTIDILAPEDTSKDPKRAYLIQPIDPLPQLNLTQLNLTADHEIVLPNQDELQKYDSMVWFHSIRNLLKNAAYPTWLTPLPLQSSFPLDQSHEQLNIASIIVGIGRLKGGRAAMEDTDTVYEGINIAKDHNIRVIGVFDGHGGKDCAMYISDELPVRLAATLKSGKIKSHAEALQESFLEVDKEYLSSTNTAGSTATVLLWREETGEGWIANVGDTRAVLCRDGQALDMTIDHKASDPEVVARVVAKGKMLKVGYGYFENTSGGFVSNNRIHAILAVGRAFGDSILKPPRSKQQLLEVYPDVIHYVPKLNDKYLIIASVCPCNLISSGVKYI